MMCIYIGKIVVTTGLEAQERCGEAYLVETEFPDDFTFSSEVSTSNSMHYGGGTRKVFEEDKDLAKIFTNDRGHFASGNFFTAKDCIDTIREAQFALFPELKEWMIAWTEKAITIYLTTPLFLYSNNQTKRNPPLYPYSHNYETS